VSTNRPPGILGFFIDKGLLTIQKGFQYGP
jgi:hypothetical protein